MSTIAGPIPPRPEPSAWQLEKSVSLWQQLHETLGEDALLSADEDVLTLPEGGTVPHPKVLLSRLIDRAIWADRREFEAENLRKRYTARRDRYTARGEAIRTTIQQLMEVLGIAAHEGDLGSVQMVKEAVHVVADIDRLPAQYVREVTTRSPDKVALAKALKALKPDETIEGASFSNPGMIPRITEY